jgi:hypothetical protein
MMTLDDFDNQPHDLWLTRRQLAEHLAVSER